MAASASSKPTAVHYWLIFFILATLVFGLLYFLTYRQVNDALARSKAADDKRKSSDQAASKALDQVTALKKVIGLTQDNVGEGNPGDQTGVVGQAIAQIKEQGGDVAQETLVATLQKLAERSRTLSNDLADQRSKFDGLNTQYLSLEGKWNAENVKEKQARDNAETQLADNTATSQKMLLQKDKDIAALKQALAETQRELDEAREKHIADSRVRDNRISQLLKTLELLNQSLDEKTRTTFEVGDGRIVIVDNTTRNVWIDLGSGDNLKPRTTFSVYRKNASKIGRPMRSAITGQLLVNDGESAYTYTDNDIKGSIEVISIDGPHLARCRITEDNQLFPMAAGDVVYTPLWSPGGTESFAFVGEFDLDGDGVSDRDVIYERIKAAGAVIDVEIDENGIRQGKGLTERTKFLVVGKLPEEKPTDSDDRVRVIKLIQKEFAALSSEAREKGVDSRNVTDFLAYIGYKPTNRVYVPGSDRDYSLKNASKGVAGQRSGKAGPSAGAVSKVFFDDRQKGASQPATPNQQRDLYRKSSVK